MLTVRKTSITGVCVDLSPARPGKPRPPVNSKEPRHWHIQTRKVAKLEERLENRINFDWLWLGCSQQTMHLVDVSDTPAALHIKSTSSVIRSFSGVDQINSTVLGKKSEKSISNFFSRNPLPRQHFENSFARSAPAQEWVGTAVPHSSENYEFDWLRCA
jgi:hypothetical protein